MKCNFLKKLFWQARNTVAVCFVLFGFSACEHLLLEESPPNDPVTNFDVFWQTFDERYSFFEYKNVDWDSVRTAYRPKVNAQTSRDSLFHVFYDMILLLRDGHSYLYGDNDVARSSDFYFQYPDNFNVNVVERNYLGKYFVASGSLPHTLLEGGKIGYIRYSDFTAPVTDSELDFVLESFKDTEGIILDVRNNGGGNPDNGFRMASRFTDERRLALTSSIKIGPGKDDYSTPDEIFIEPAGEIRYEKPVILLTNRRCYSATTFFTAMMRVIPSVTVMGDYTGGGGGVPAAYELPNGWTFGFSSTVSILPDGLNMEGGIPPDVSVMLAPEDEAQGIDTIIEAAIAEILNP